jgi:hypothetical protein
MKCKGEASKGLEEILTGKGIRFDCNTILSLIAQLAVQRSIGSAKYNGLFNKNALILCSLNPTFERVISQAPMGKKNDLIPGDIRVWDNPEGKGAYRYENSLYLGSREYFAHPFGIVDKFQLIQKLTPAGATTKAFDMGYSIRIIVPMNP